MVFPTGFDLRISYLPLYYLTAFLYCPRPVQATAVSHCCLLPYLCRCPPASLARQGPILNQVSQSNTYGLPQYCLLNLMRFQQQPIFDGSLLTYSQDSVGSYSYPDAVFIRSFPNSVRTWVYQAWVGHGGYHHTAVAESAFTVLGGKPSHKVGFEPTFRSVEESVFPIKLLVDIEGIASYPVCEPKLSCTNFLLIAKPWFVLDQTRTGNFQPLRVFCPLNYKDIYWT